MPTSNPEKIVWIGCSNHNTQYRTLLLLHFYLLWIRACVCVCLFICLYESPHMYWLGSLAKQLWHTKIYEIISARVHTHILARIMCFYANRRTTVEQSLYVTKYNCTKWSKGIKQVYGQRVSERVVNVNEKKTTAAMKICKRNPPVHRLISNKKKYARIWFLCVHVEQRKRVKRRRLKRRE